MGDSVTSIGERAFRNCSSLTSVVIGKGVTRISDSTFGECDNLASVIIPDSVISIGKYAFYGCSSLINIYYRGTESQWSNMYKDANWDYSTGNYTITYNYDGE